MTTKQAIFDGNSLTTGAGSTPGNTYPQQTLAMLGDEWHVHNVAVGGTSTQDMITRAATTVYPLFDIRLQKNVLVLWEMTNDIFFGATGAEAITHFTTLCANARTAASNVGVALHIIALTVLPRVEGGWSQASADACNVWLRDPARLGVEFDALADVEAIPQLVPATPEYYVFAGADYVHLTDAGYAMVAASVAAKINAA